MWRRSGKLQVVPQNIRAYLQSALLSSAAEVAPSPDWKLYSGPSGYEIWLAVSKGVGGIPEAVG